jgi:hypothetical protein
VSDHSSFWDLLRVLVLETFLEQEKTKAIAVINQLVHLPHYIQMWIDMAVDTPERFEFFVMAKAHEMHSNDQTNDYYWALQIRHDQLIALIDVLSILILQMKQWIVRPPKLLFDDSVFSGLTDIGIEDQVYLQAEKIYKDRSHGNDN